MRILEADFPRDLHSPFWTLNRKQLISRPKNAIFFKRRNGFEGLNSCFNKVSTFGIRKVTHSAIRPSTRAAKKERKPICKGLFWGIIKRRINVSRFPPIFEYGRKIIHSTRAFLYASFLIENDGCPTVLNLNSFLSPNYSKFAVEWTDLKKFLKHVRNLGRFEKLTWLFFFKKLECFSKLAKLAILL